MPQFDTFDIVSLGATLVSIGITLGVMRTEFKYLKQSVAKLEGIVTNGLASKVDKIEQRIEDLPCKEC